MRQSESLSARTLRTAGGLVLLVAVLMSAHVSLAHATDRATQQQGRSTGLSIPRFVSLKADRVNLRNGPGTDYPTSWVFRRAGMPVEILKEFETWRQVRDAEGATGWVLHSMLSGRRTALILPWELKPDQPAPQIQLRSDDDGRGAVVAVVEAGVIANVRNCDGRWCFVIIGDYRGYIEQSKLWGVYAGEVVR